MTTTDEHLQMVTDCEARESRLSEWEATFIDSIWRQLASGRALTERQAETLNRAWGKATEREKG